MTDKGPEKRKAVRAGSLVIGGDAPVSVQSMTTLPVEDVEGSVSQIESLRKNGADLVRVALRNEKSVSSLARLLSRVDIPLCADIHFNHRIALGAIDAGVAKIRLNPGNIGSRERVREVVRSAEGAGVPIRIGVNAGSLDRKRYLEATPENLVESVMEHVRILEDLGFSDTVLSIKASDISTTIEANRLLALKSDYPIHLGLTEAGYGQACVVQSSITLGHLLLKGIGDTIRVSMTGDPVEEVVTGKLILQSLGMRFTPLRMVSCPTCGRCDPSIDLLSLAREVERGVLERYGKILEERGRRLEVAVMGCEVNGPGEAAHADAGLAGAGKGKLLLFSSGEKRGIVQQERALDELLREIGKVLESG